MARRILIAQATVRQGKPVPNYVPLGERITFQIPLTAGLSKNHQHGVHRGRIYVTNEAMAARAALEWCLKSSLHGRILQPRRKVWLDIQVQRADMRSDPINVLDAVADAIKTVVGIDDRWFAVARLDWTLVRGAAPWVQVTMWQSPEEEMNGG